MTLLTLLVLTRIASAAPFDGIIGKHRLAMNHSQNCPETIDVIWVGTSKSKQFLFQSSSSYSAFNEAFDLQKINAAPAQQDLVITEYWKDEDHFVHTRLFEKVSFIGNILTSEYKAEARLAQSLKDYTFTGEILSTMGSRMSVNLSKKDLMTIEFSDGLGEEFHCGFTKIK